MNNFDFEQAIKADREQPNLFGPAVNMTGAQQPFAHLQNFQQLSHSHQPTTNKRDLLWEQKRNKASGAPPAMNAPAPVQDPFLAGNPNPIQPPTQFPQPNFQPPKRSNSPAGPRSSDAQKPPLMPPVMQPPNPMDGFQRAKAVGGKAIEPNGEDFVTMMKPPQLRAAPQGSTAAQAPRQGPPGMMQAPPPMPSMGPPIQIQNQQMPQQMAPQLNPANQGGPPAMPPPVQKRVNFQLSPHQEPVKAMNPPPQALPPMQQMQPVQQVQQVAPSNPPRQAPGSLQKSGAKTRMIEEEPEMPGGGDFFFANRKGPDPDKNAKQRDEYLSIWKEQIEAKEAKKKVEREQRIMREKAELEALMKYNPFEHQPVVKKNEPAPQEGIQIGMALAPEPVQPPVLQQPPMLQQAAPPQMMPPGMPQPPQFQQPIGMVPPMNSQGMPPVGGPTMFPPEQQQPPMLQAPQINFQVQNQQPLQQLQPPPQQQFAKPPPVPGSATLQNNKEPGSAAKADGRDSRGGIGAYEYDINGNIIRQQAQKQELQNALKQQMEEQRLRKQEEARKKKLEEEAEERRIQKERDELEAKFKAEKEKKQRKIIELNEANIKIAEGHKNVRNSGEFGSDLIRNSQKEKLKQKKTTPVEASLPINTKADLFGPPPVGGSADSFLSGPPQNTGDVFQINNPTMNKAAPPGGMNSGLQNQQQQLITDLKQNFSKEMDELKAQMVQQQELFKQQMDRLLEDQEQARKRKEQAEKELKDMKQEVEFQNEKEKQYQEVITKVSKQQEQQKLQHELQNVLDRAFIGQDGSIISQVGPSPNEIFAQYQRQNSRGEPSKPQSRESRGSSARIPANVLAQQQLKFPPVESSSQLKGQLPPRQPSQPTLNPSGSRQNLGVSRKSERGGGKSHLQSYGEILMSSGSKPSSKPPPSKDKSYMVDLRGYGYTPYKKAQKQQQDLVEAKAYQDKYLGTGKKSMVGESDFVPIQAAGNGLVDPLKASIKRGDEDPYYLKGNTSKLILGTENSDIKERIDFTPTNPKLGESRGGITDTMDFIDRMLKKQELPHEPESPLNLKALHEPLELPAYDGPQKSLLAKRPDDMVGLLSKQNTSITSEGTLRSLNLDALNKRQDERLEQIMNQQFDFDEAIEKSKKPHAKKAVGGSELEKVDNLLFDILRG